MNVNANLFTRGNKINVEFVYRKIKEDSMKILVVFDSQYGNTQKIAEAIAKALGGKDKASVIPVGKAKTENLLHLDYLIVGSPTQAFNPLRPVTTFLKSIPRGGLTGTKVAAFDTRMDVAEVNVGILIFFAKIFGFAAQKIAKLLVKKGGELSVPPEGFIVKGSEGPLKRGELERVAVWAKKILKTK
jgi:flavodoxin